MSFCYSYSGKAMDYGVCGTLVIYIHCCGNNMDAMVKCQQKSTKKVELVPIV